MANKSVNSDKKIMDVSKPGKGKIVTTSRPVISPVASDTETATAPEITAPSTTRKIIQPISSTDELVENGTNDAVPAKATSIKIITNTPEDNEEPVKVGKKSKQNDAETTEAAPPEPTDKVPETESSDAAETTEPVADEAETATEEDPAPETDQAEPTEPSPSETTVDEPKAAEPAPEPTEDKAEEAEVADKPAEDQANNFGSDAAQVDTIAQSTETKKEAVKKAEAQAAKDAELQKLIDSHEYFVPIGHHPSHKSKKGQGVLIFLLLLVVILGGAYFAVDAELVNVNLKLPYDLVK